MPSARLLVIEGNSPQTLSEHLAVGGTPAHQGYSNLLRELLPGAIVDTAHPGDPSATLPSGGTAHMSSNAQGTAAGLSWSIWTNSGP